MLMDTTNDNFRPYLFHKVEFNGTNSGANYYATCPFCGRENKFAVNINTGLYRCVVCAEGNESGGGNATVFVRRLWEMYDTTTTNYDILATDRTLLFPETLMEWGAVWNSDRDCWIIPGYTVKGEIGTLYCYYSPDGGKKRLLPTPTLGHHLFGFHLFDPNKKRTYITEGPWDAMALYELLARVTENDDDGYYATADRQRSLLSESNVIGVPGANVFRDTWAGLFGGHDVILMYDNDHPKKHPKTGSLLKPVGYAAVQRVSKMLATSSNPPASIRYLRWGEYGYNQELPSGFDVRDLLTQE